MNGFISYSHDNAAQMETLAGHLHILKLAHGLTFWWDESNHAGSRFDTRIEQAIAAADVGLVLTSNASLGSWYITKKEIPALRAQEKSRGILLVPLVLDDCIHRTYFPNEVGIPSRNKRTHPVNKWNPRAPAYFHSCMMLVDAVSAHFGRKPRPSFKDHL